MLHQCGQVSKTLSCLSIIIEKGKLTTIANLEKLTWILRQGVKSLMKTMLDLILHFLRLQILFVKIVWNNTVINHCHGCTWQSERNSSTSSTLPQCMSNQIQFL